MYVADHNNHQIQIFTVEGKFLRMFGRRGEDTGDLWGAVAIDASDRVYISERGNHCISVFTTEGQYMMSFGSEGAGPGQFDIPRGLAVDHSGVVYVCDRINNSVQLF